ncbi:MAG: hypothetical protein ACRC7O_02230 [Fimbriiglobus sp.]
MTKSELWSIDGVGESIRSLAKSITPNLVPAPDAAGGRVESLTEAVMGVTAGLCRIADAIGDLAAAVRERPAGD